MYIRNWLPLGLPLPAHRRFQRNLDVINRFIAERIAEGRRAPEQNNLLSVLLRSRDEETGQMLGETDLRRRGGDGVFCGL